jgi:C4-dicarboxylate-specific signal transduction histidine kinase
MLLDLQPWGEMEGGIAHEINNPLAIISGSVFALKRSLEKQNFQDEKVNERLFKIEETVKRISNIILGMRNLSRSELSDTTSHFNLKQLINDTLNLCHERFLTEGINLSFNESDFDQEVLGSYQQYGQILINLLNNAFDVVKHKSDKYVGIEIAREEYFVSIRVVDSGDGVSEVSKLFQPFYTTKPIGEGTGLGLSISKKIAQKNGGDLFYFRKKDKIVFEIKIPKAS